MCNYLIEQNRQCKLAKNKELCHFHKNMKPKIFKNELLDDLKIFELNDKNFKLEKKVDKLLNFQNNQKAEITNLYNVIQKKNKLLRESEEYIIKLKITINNMKDDYDNYQHIINYEKMKNKLLNAGIDIYKYNDDEFHKNRQIRNALAHKIC